MRHGGSAKIEKFIRIGTAAPAEELERLRKRAPKQHALLAFLAQQIQPVKKAIVLTDCWWR